MLNLPSSPNPLGAPQLSVQSQVQCSVALSMSGFFDTPLASAMTVLPVVRGTLSGHSLPHLRFREDLGRPTWRVFHFLLLRTMNRMNALVLFVFPVICLVTGPSISHKIDDRPGIAVRNLCVRRLYTCRNMGPHHVFDERHQTLAHLHSFLHRGRNTHTPLAGRGRVML